MQEIHISDFMVECKIMYTDILRQDREETQYRLMLEAHYV